MVPYATEVCSPSLRVQKLKLKMLAGLVSPKSCKGEFTRPSLLASGGCWHSLELLGLELPSHLRLCAHRAFSSLSVCLKSPSPLIRTLVIDVGPTPSPRWCYANIFNLIIPVKILYSNHVISTDTKGWQFRYILFSSVQSLGRVWLFETPWTAAHQASLSITNSRTWPKLMSIESVMPSNHLILRHPLLLLPSIFPSIRVFSNESTLRIRWPKYWDFSFNTSPPNEHPGLISFRMDWLDLLAVQGTLKSLLQHYSSKASILQRSAFFIVQLSHPYMTTGKTIALTRRTFVGKVMSLLLNMLSRLVITFLSRSKHLLILWLQSPSAVILEPPKIKSVNVSIVSPSICHEVLGPYAMIFVFWMLSFQGKKKRVDKKIK